MKEKLLIVGAGGLGRVVLEHSIQKYDCSFLDDGPAIGSVVDGIKVIGRTSELSYYYPEYSQLIVAIGNNRIREELYKRAEKVGYSFPNIIVPSAYISSHALIGNGCVILNNAVVQNNARIGNGCVLNPGVEAHHDSLIGDYCLIYTNSVVRSLTKVGNRVWIGSNTTISTGATVPDDAIVDDGSCMRCP